ncbi:MAG: PIN domain-containing protein [Gemmatimonadota bacterium]
MILVDTGPFVAMFDPRDEQHSHCLDVVATLSDTLVTTDAVLTEAFHMLGPGTINCGRFREFVAAPALRRWPLDDDGMHRVLDLMEEYEDHPMDFADASLVAAAEVLRTTTIFTLDRSDFATYRPRIGRTLSRFRFL